MKFVIGGANVKTFAKSILALSKIGDEIYVEPLQSSLTLRTVNGSRSAFACFSFKQSFFTFFEPDLIKRNHLNTTVADNTLLNNTTHDNSIEESEPFKCKVPAKCLLSIFKNMNSIEKNVEKCTITVKYIPISQESAGKVYDYDSTMMTKMLNKNNEEQLFDTKFLIIMNCKYGLRKTFILSISDCENLQAAFSAQSCTNKLNIGAKYLHETINSFSNDTEEVSFLVDANKLIIKNYIEPENDTKSTINTQVTFDSDEFNSYEIEKEMDITFCLKEFKICLTYGFWFDLSLDIYFKKKGRPIIFNYSNGNYEANFTLATLLDDLSTTQSTTISSNPNHSMQQSMINSRIETENNSTTNNINNNKRLSRNSSVHEVPNAAKGNKRSLFDASNNQCYLGDNDTEMRSPDREPINKNNDDSAEEDALLTQILEQQESVLRNSQPTKPPPAKKHKSLVQSLFEENDDSNQSNESNNVTKKPTSFVNFLEDESESEEDNAKNAKNAKKGAASIYVENTDSEEE